MTVLARIRRSRWRVVVQSLALAGMILQPVPMARSYWTDPNNDGVKEWVDDPAQGDSWWTEDGDGDGWCNFDEVVYGSDPYRLDSDFDGITDKDEHDLLPLNGPWDFDSDDDGFSDFDEYYEALQGIAPMVNYATLIAAGTSFSSTFDADGDGIQNPWDPDPCGFDRDGDGIVNWQDGWPDDPGNGSTPPASGPPPDSDGDGNPDASDPFPWGSYSYNGGEYGGTWTDSDGDGVPDPADTFPNGSFNYNGMEFSGAWVDQDNDTIPDVADSFPNGSYWYNGFEYAGGWVDSDLDGTPDELDLFPNGSYKYADVEYAGSWVDQDNDGIPDPADAFPGLSGSYWYNGTQYGGAWADADGDGVPDSADNFPNGSYWYNGGEYEGTWTDADSDGIPDAQDRFPTGSFWYDGAEYGGTWADADDDGVPDGADPWPDDRWNGQPFYRYNGSDYAGEWSDRDGDDVPDPADSWPDDPENNLDSDGDGLSNYMERTQTHTNPAYVDSDNDYLTDYEEALIYHTDPNDPRSIDGENLDADALPAVSWTDTDHDGIADRVEDHYAQLGHAMNKNQPADANGDLDSDGYSNLQAYNQGWDLVANLNVYDTDGDGITNVMEDAHPGVLDKTLFADAVADADGDGLFNFEEVAAGYDPFKRNSFVRPQGCRGKTVEVSDPDNPPFLSDFYRDGNDFEELYFPFQEWHGSVLVTPTPFQNMPNLPGSPGPPIGDWDWDGIPDWWEYRHQLSLRGGDDDRFTHGGDQGDPDGDGLPNLQEFQFTTHPRIADSDGDGFSDGYEVAQGTDPKLTSSSPLVLAQQQLAGVQVLAANYQALVNANSSFAVQLAAWQAASGAWEGLQSVLDQLSQQAITTTAQSRVSDIQAQTQQIQLTDPNRDEDGDQLPDRWEQEHFSDLYQSGDGDHDWDGLTNLQEYLNNLDPKMADQFGLYLKYKTKTGSAWTNGFPVINGPASGSFKRHVTEIIMDVSHFSWDSDSWHDSWPGHLSYGTSRMDETYNKTYRRTVTQSHVHPVMNSSLLESTPNANNEVRTELNESESSRYLLTHHSTDYFNNNYSGPPPYSRGSDYETSSSWEETTQGAQSLVNNLWEVPANIATVYTMSSEADSHLVTWNASGTHDPGPTQSENTETRPGVASDDVIGVDYEKGPLTVTNATKSTGTRYDIFTFDADNNRHLAGQRTFNKSVEDETTLADVMASLASDLPSRPWVSSSMKIDTASVGVDIGVSFDFDNWPSASNQIIEYYFEFVTPGNKRLIGVPARSIPTAVTYRPYPGQPTVEFTEFDLEPGQKTEVQQMNAMQIDSTVPASMELRICDLYAHSRGTIESPGAELIRLADGDYEAVTIENGDIDHYWWDWSIPILEPDDVDNDGFQDAVVNRQAIANSGCLDMFSLWFDDDFIMLRVDSGIPSDVPMNVSLEFIEPSGARNVSSSNVFLYNREGYPVEIGQLQLSGSTLPASGPVHDLFTEGRGIFVEIGDLGRLVDEAKAPATPERDHYKEITIRVTLSAGGGSMVREVKIVRGGLWIYDRRSDAGLGFFDGKGLLESTTKKQTIDIGYQGWGPFQTKNGLRGVTNEFASKSGPSPDGWYDLGERTEFANNGGFDRSRGYWRRFGNVQEDRSVFPFPLESLKANPKKDNSPKRYQGGYSLWRTGEGHISSNQRIYDENADGPTPPTSIKFKFDMIPDKYTPAAQFLFCKSDDQVWGGSAEFMLR